MKNRWTDGWIDRWKELLRDIQVLRTGKIEHRWNTLQIKHGKLHCKEETRCPKVDPNPDVRISAYLRCQKLTISDRQCFPNNSSQLVPLCMYQMGGCHSISSKWRFSQTDQCQNEHPDGFHQRSVFRIIVFVLLVYCL